MAGTSTAAGTVTVACKMPNGVALRVFEEYEFAEAMGGGMSRTVKQFRQVGEEVHVKGNAAPHGISIMTPGGYALTSGINQDFWDQFYAQNKDSAIIKSGQLFAMPREETAASRAREQAEVKSGLERMDPENLPIRGIKTATSN